eukprot:15552-Rhodomonas_salina.1
METHGQRETDEELEALRQRQTETDKAHRHRHGDRERERERERLTRNLKLSTRPILGFFFLGFAASSPCSPPPL